MLLTTNSYGHYLYTTTVQELANNFRTFSSHTARKQTESERTSVVAGGGLRSLPLNVLYTQLIGQSDTVGQRYSWLTTKFLQTIYTVSQKTVQNCFCQNFVKFPPILIIFGSKMLKRLKLCEMYSFSTSSNSRHHTKLLTNCYTTL